MHKVEKCLDGPLLPKKTLRGKEEPRLVKEKNTPVPRLGAQWSSQRFCVSISWIQVLFLL